MNSIEQNNPLIRLPRFYKTGRCLPLLCSLVALLLFSPHLVPEDGTLPPIAARILFSLSVLAGVIALINSLRSLIVVSAFGLPLLIIEWVPANAYPSQFHGIGGIASAVFYSVATILIMLSVWKGHPRPSERIYGGISIYLLMGIAFSIIYSNLLLYDPTSFTIIGADDKKPHWDELLYFSFVTLTTLGYGDIVPQTPTARSTAILESLVGVVFLATFISTLVAEHQRDTRLRDQSDGGSEEGSS